ncbi:ATP-grasp ribosomal peptide maturase [Thermopolyspora sp. NPDC052614]|uniref:ATP-grasp ribosomal peptide maturase n=1 Tax=Thermopolyspora sp. NPDC052614 TaxID=3155682 RepID=UPI00344942DE
MSARVMVLILAADHDRTVDRVAAELTGRGVPVTRVDTADFPIGLRLGASFSNGAGHWGGRLTGHTEGGRSVLVDLAEVTSVYYRHPTQFRLPEGMSGPERIFAYNEARRGFGGVLQALDCLWVNDPVRSAAAAYKPVQLAAAAAVGLRVPDTVIANDPEYIRSWAAGLGRPIIYKPVGGIWHPEAGEIRMIYTERVEDLGWLRDAGLDLTAHMFQEWVEKAHEARAVVIGGQVFTMAIHTDSPAGRVDWRSDYDANRYEPVELPAGVRNGLIRLHERLGLVFGACDLIRTPEGEWVFLETNVTGEWGWLEANCGVPIAKTIADVLEAGRVK